MTNAGSSARTVTVKVDAHSELMTEYPWGSAASRPTLPTTWRIRRSTTPQAGALVFRDQGKLPHPNAPEHDYAAMVASTMTARRRETGASPNEYRGPQGTNVCTTEAAPERVRRRPVRQGQGRPAALLGHRARRRVGDTLGRRGGLRQGACGRLGASSRAPFAIRARSSRPRSLSASAGAASPGSRCRATGASRRRSTGASRTSSISPGSLRTCRFAGRTRASSSRRPRGRWRAPAGWVPASPTTRGCSPPTASTPRSRASRSASSRRSRTTCVRCARSRTSSTTARGS